MKVALFGTGRMARAVAKVLAGAGAELAVFGRTHGHVTKLVHEVPHAKAAASVKDAVAGASLIFFAVPAPAIAEVAALYGEHALGDHLVLHASRGVGEGFQLPHAMIRATSCVRKIGVLGGPLHANELTSGRPLVTVLASRFQETIASVQAMVKGTPVAVHGSRDVIGVEVAGALSNVAAIASGMSDALDLGDTARGVLLTRGLGEAKRIGVALGAEAQTFGGLAGVGDLIPRKVSSTDRHRLLGARIAEGKALGAVREELGTNIEGVLTAKEAAKLARKLGLELPLVTLVDDVLEGKRPAREALESVLSLDLELDLDPRAPSVRAPLN